MIIETLREIVACCTRKIPYSQRLGLGFMLFNRWVNRTHACPIGTAKMKDRSILKIDLRSSTEVHAYYRGEYDLELITIIKRILDPQTIFLDVGANIGFYAIAIGQHIRQSHGSGQIFAFEPYLGNYARLQENILLNALSDIVTPYSVGLSNTQGETVLVLREDFQQGALTGNASVFIHETVDANYQKVPVQMISLDDFLKTHILPARIDFIKVDIEGHEDYFLEGASGTLRNHRPIILMEVNKSYYQARMVNLNARFKNLLPENYRIIRKSQQASWQEIKSFDECQMIDDVFLIPTERMNSTLASIFAA
jgi:FkbM family methyltransferase